MFPARFPGARPGGSRVTGGAAAFLYRLSDVNDLKFIDFIKIMQNVWVWGAVTGCIPVDPLDLQIRAPRAYARVSPSKPE